MISEENKWSVESNDRISFQLDEHHKFYVERIENGFSLKVFDERGHDHKPEEPILLYHKKISDSQLGHVGILKNER